MPTWTLSTSTVVAALVLWGTISTILAWLRPKPLPGIPHRPITNVWGDVLEVHKANSENGVVSYFFEPLAAKLGPLCQVMFGPAGNIVLLSDAQEIEDLLVRRAKSLEASLFASKLVGGVLKYSQNSLKSNDPIYKKHRRLLTPSMSPKYLRLMTPRINSNIGHLVHLWRDKMRIVEQNGGSCFSCESDLRFCTMDTFGEICFGESFHGLHNTQSSLYDLPPLIGEHGEAMFPNLRGSMLHEAVVYLFQVLGDGLSFPPPILPIYFMIVRLSASWRTSYGALSSFFKRRIFEARARADGLRAHGMSQESADCIIDMVMEREGKEEGDKMSEGELLDELLGLVCAAQDTTTSAFSFGLKYLGRHPEVQVRLRKELMTNLSEPVGRSLTYDEIASNEDLPYLEAVAAEILRLSSVGPAVHRELTEDMVILGHPIPKGTNIVLLTGFASRHTTDGESEAHARALDPLRSKTSNVHGLSKGRWSVNDASLFKPERWLVEDTRPEKGRQKVRFSAKQGVSMPFGTGPRSCFGIKLATLQTKLVLASLNLTFFFDRITGQLDSDKVKEVFIRHPEHAYVALREWDDALSFAPASNC